MYNLKSLLKKIYILSTKRSQANEHLSEEQNKVGKWWK